MNWKSHYEAERRAAGARQTLESWLVADADLRAAEARRAVVSFPHTALRYAGPLVGRLAHALHDSPRVERVLALGVLHGSGIEPYRTALDDAAPEVRRASGFAAVRGAFIAPERDIQTAFGPVPAWRPDPGGAVRQDGEAYLGAEFSLDTLAAALRVAADACGRKPLPVCSLYVGMTRDPVTGSFAAARELGDWLRAHADRATAVVATGDLVHYGTAYGGAWLPGHPTSPAEIEGALRPEVERLLAAAFLNGDWDGAYRLSRERLGNDQREILAPLSSYLDVGARATLLSFALSDYAAILGAEPPCLVASALAVYDRAT